MVNNGVCYDLFQLKQDEDHAVELSLFIAQDCFYVFLAVFSHAEIVDDAWHIHELHVLYIVLSIDQGLGKNVILVP